MSRAKAKTWTQTSSTSLNTSCSTSQTAITLKRSSKSGTLLALWPAKPSLSTIASTRTFLKHVCFTMTILLSPPTCYSACRTRRSKKALSVAHRTIAWRICSTSLQQCSNSTARIWERITKASSTRRCLDRCRLIKRPKRKLPICCST